MFCWQMEDVKWICLCARAKKNRYKTHQTLEDTTWISVVLQVFVQDVMYHVRYIRLTDVIADHAGLHAVMSKPTVKSTSYSQ